MSTILRRISPLLQPITWSRCFSTVNKSRRFAALWGNGDYGRLGLGSLESKWIPTACDFFHNDPPVHVSCGGAHTLFLTESGHVYAVGLNNFGQLGTASATSHSLEPVKVIGITQKVTKITAGYHHSSAITEAGELFVWGKNSSGQLGLGKRSKNTISTPTKVEALAGMNVKTVALGAEHSVAQTDEGSVLSWGAGDSGRLGHGHQSSILGFSLNSSEYTPRLIKYFEGIKVQKIAAGMLHSACITDEGTLYVFGERTSAKLSFGGPKSISVPSAVQEIPYSEEVACGGYHTCVIASNGSLCTWGSNENGCLGLGSVDMVPSPESIESSLFKFPVSEVSCGWKHTAAISGGNVFTWGWGGASGTFLEDGHSSGGQLVCFPLSSLYVPTKEKTSSNHVPTEERYYNLHKGSSKFFGPIISMQRSISVTLGHGNDVDYFEPMMITLSKNVKALHISCGFNHSAGIFEYTEP